MEVINTFVGEMAKVLTEHLFTSIGRQIGYVVHYKKNIEELDAKIRNLEGLRGRIEGKVDTARNNGEVIENDVLNWLTDVNKKEEERNRLLVEKGNINSCFDVCSRYQLGKKGKKLLSDVPGLIDRCNNFDTVGHRAPLDKIWCTPTTNFETFESRKLVRKQIREVMKDDMIYTIGIHGMPGTGKTRMAEDIAKQTQEEKLFDEVAKAVFSQIPDLKKIQKELAECLNLSFRTETEIGRKGELCNRLKNGRKILVIIDDIWNDEIKLEEIGIPSTGNHIKGCKVLFTSREEDVFNGMGVKEKFQIRQLEEDEAWNLFRKTVGDFIESSQEIHSIAKQVCKECDGLPLAILVVGAALRDQKEMYAWKDALFQLANCRGGNIKGVTEKLYSRIEWSYKYQKQQDVRSCFLHCSLFSEDAEIPIDDLVMYGVTTRFLKDNLCTMERARNRTLVLTDMLKKSHLLLEGESKDFVKMHDVIRDVAISIASKEGFLAKWGVQRWPEKDDEYKSREVISVRSKDIWQLPCELECPELCTLVLECNYKCKPQVPDSFFKGSEKLQVLELRFVRLPSSPLNLVHLRMLRLYYCEQINLVFLKELRNLEILSIADYDLKEVVVEVGQLTSLRWLDLSNCKKLEIIPSGVIKSLSNIEELYFPFEFKGWGNEGNARLDELKSLTRLTTVQIHIEDELELPNELLRSELYRFKISIGRTSFTFWEDNVGARMLKLDYITLRKEFTILMAKADVLVLERMEGLKNVLHSEDGKGFLDLNNLKIRGCNDMEHLLGRPKGNLQAQGSFSKLSVLVVENCTLKFLFFSSMARTLLQLQELHISNCEIMEEIILDDEQVMDKVIFHQLRKITLGGLPILRSIYGDRKKASTTECSTSTSTSAQALFNEKVSFPTLEELDISELNSATTILDNQLLVSTSFQQLTSLTISRCHSLRNVFSPSIAKNLRQLQELTVSNCEKIEDIIAVETVQGEEEVTDDEIIVFPQLKRMKLNGLPNHKSFWSGFEKAAVKNDIPQVQALFNHKVKFPSLEEFEYIRNENNLKEIWSSTVPIDAFCKLRKLRVEYCDKLLSIGPPSKLLQNLEKGLETTGVEKVSTSFQQLTSLTISSCHSLRNVFSPSIAKNLRQLQELTVSTSFQQLTSLTISSCHSLRNVFSPSIAKNLRQLQELTVSNCEKIEDIIAIETVQGEEEVTDDEIIVFPQLKRMKLNGLPNLKSFWSGFEKAAVKNDIPQVQALFNHKVKFPSLENFEYSQNKNNFKEIWSSTVPIDAFCKLRELRVTNCDKLLSIAPPSNLLQNLEELYIEECPNLEKGLETTGVEKVSTSFQQLTSLTIDSCHSLRNVFSPSIARNLRQLQKLKVSGCEKIEDIIAVETVQGEEEVTDDEIIVFPQLKEMELQWLPNLKSFWSSTCGSNKEAMEDDISQVHALFNYKVKFPSLEKFFYSGSKNNLKEIWNTTVPIDYFCKLRRLTVGGCDELLSVAPSKLVGSFHNLEELYIWKCPSLEEIFKVEGKSNNAEEGIVVARDKDIEEDLETISELPSLVKMEITNCPKLKSAALYTSKEKVVFPILETLGLSDESIFEDIWYGHVPAGSFSKVRKLMVKNCNTLVNVPTLLQRFEVVEELTVFNCSSLEVVFNLEGLEDIERGGITKLELLAFHNLRFLTVISCNSLKCLFSLSMARNLTEIENLRVEFCDAIEEVIRNEDQGEEDGVMDEIVFPKLQSISLVYLKNLTSFCGANNAFKLPSLLSVGLRNCPKMQTFTSGRISTKLIKLRGDNFFDVHEVSDLNKYVEQCVEKRKGRDAEETSLANKIEETSEETRLGDEIKDDEETS